MRLLAYSTFIVLAAFSASAQKSQDQCKCFEGFRPESEANSTYCRGEKLGRIFSCNDEQPPLCKCKYSGEEVVLDLGETSCLDSKRQYDSLNCEPLDEWEAYLNRHPDKRIYY